MTPEDRLRENASNHCGNGHYQTVALDGKVMLILHPVVDGHPEILTAEIKIDLCGNISHLTRLDRP